MNVGLALAVFLASAVEAVEAATIVMAMGTARDWRSALAGTGAALLALGAIIAALGPALSTIPLGTLRLIVGGMMLAFGLQWLRKAILRASGHKARHDEEAIYAAQRDAAARANAPTRSTRIDGYAFGIALKGVLLEGVEVAFIAVTFGAGQHRVPLAAAAAASAAVVVALAATALRAPLARVPENAMKLTVGVLLTSFGTFWGSEGAGISWPAGDVAVVGVLTFIAACTLLLTTALGRPREVVA